MNIKIEGRQDPNCWNPDFWGKGDRQLMVILKGTLRSDPTSSRTYLWRRRDAWLVLNLRISEEASWVLELRCKEERGVNCKLALEAEAPILWPPDVKSWLIGKDPNDGKDWKKEEKGTTEEMVVWHPRLNGHEFEQVTGDGEGQGSLVCCRPWRHKQ